MEVYRCLSQCDDAHLNDQLLAHDLSRLNFLNYRVRHPQSGERWNPLASSLLSFLGQEERPSCWHWDSPSPSSEQIANWLLMQLNGSAILK